MAGSPPSAQVDEAGHDTVIDARGGYVLPGFIQTHVHLCQTLFRGFADDMPLLEWLKMRVWPMEAAHTPSTLRASVRLAAAELLRTGTTSVLTMETVHDTDVVFETLAEVGLRATVGKCMMDSDSDVPRRLQEETRASIDESLGLKKRWHGAANGRLRAAFAPRFAVSCSRELLEAVAALAVSEQALVHTHASENRDEVEFVRRMSGGLSNMEYLADTGLATPHLCTAHCVWVTDAEQALMAERGVKVLHCPGSNLKLGSGHRPGRRDAGARHLGLARRRWRRLQQPAGHVRRDAARRDPSGDAQGARRAPGPRRRLDGDARGRARARAGERNRVDRAGQARGSPPHRQGRSAPGSRRRTRGRRSSMPPAGPTCATVVVDGEMLVHDFALTRMDAVEVSRTATAAAAELAGRAGL